MPIRSPLKFGCAPLTHAHRIIQRDYILAGKLTSLDRMGRLRVNPGSGRRNFTGSQVLSSDKVKLNLNLDMERPRDASEERHLSLPLLIYMYSPLKMLSTKYSLWKLKIFWDWQFIESEFVEKANQAAMLVARMIADQREMYIKRCTTPMGCKQIKHDLINAKDKNSFISPYKLMRFEKRHIKRSIILKVQRMEHYGHKFAFIDMIILTCRCTKDFTSKSHLAEIQQLLKHYADDQVVVSNPFVCAKIFVRFRRDYSLPSTMPAGRWLVSTFKVLQLDLRNDHPEFYGGDDVGVIKSLKPLP